MSEVRISEIWSESPVRREVARLAAAAGRSLFLTGGALRDLFIGRPVCDWDLSLREAPAFARQVADRFDAILVMLDEDQPTTRVVVKGASEDDRQVLDFCETRGGDIREDLGCRDFTVNAMAWEVGEGGTEVIDPYGGRRDLAQGVVRALSRQALVEDPVRMLRAFRIAAHLDAAIERQTVGWIGQQAPQLTASASERIGAELLQLLEAADVAGELRLMDEIGLLEQIIPEIKEARGVTQGGYHHLDVWEHTLLAVELLEEVIAHPRYYFPESEQVVRQYLDQEQVRPGLKLAALIHDLGKPATRSTDGQRGVWFRGHEELGAQMAQDIATRLHAGRGLSRMVTVLVREHLRPLQLIRDAVRLVESERKPSLEEVPTRGAIGRLMRDAQPHGVGLLILAAADVGACQGPATHPVRRMRCLRLLDELLRRWSDWQHEDGEEPILTGQDLIEELGLEPGPIFGEILSAVGEAHLDGEVITRAQALKMARHLAERL